MQIREYSFRGRQFKANVVDRYQSDPSWFSFEDETEIRDRDWNIKPGDIIFDIGSGYGSYTLTALVSEASFVHCWNPDVDENLFLKGSLELNGWSNKVAIYENALWSSSGYGKLIPQQARLEFSEVPEEGLFRVCSLDEQVKEMDLKRLDWMKIDIEGAEVEVLKGAVETIKKFHPVIQTENHQFFDSTIEQRIRDLMLSLEYTEIHTNRYHGVTHSLYKFQ